MATGYSMGMHRTLLILALATSSSAFAGRPLFTEDATVLEQGHCQLELWMDRYKDATDVWMAPACNFGANIELEAGASRTFAAGTAALSQSYFQVKTAFRSVDDHPWGVGLVLGVNRVPLREVHKGWDDPFAIVPVSFKVGEDNLLHLNVGWVRNREQGRDLTLWGVALEVPVTESITLLGETFGENTARPFLSVGGRATAIKDRLEFDLTYVARPGGTSAERFVSLGLYYKTP